MCRSASIWIQIVTLLQLVCFTAASKVVANVSITCETQDSCSNKTLHCGDGEAPSSSDTCTINCEGISSCHNTTVYSRQYQNVVINGFGLHSLSKMVIYAPSSGMLMINATAINTTSSSSTEVLFSNSTIRSNNGSNITVSCQRESQCTNNAVILQLQAESNINVVANLRCNNMSFMTNVNISSSDCESEWQQDICKINIDGSWNLDMQRNKLSIKSCDDHSMTGYCGCKLQKVLKKVWCMFFSVVV